MTESDRAWFRALLQKHRREALAGRARNERGVEEIREGRTDPEYEEGAQADHSEYLLEQLSDTQRQGLEQIDMALDRLEAGTYGACIDCKTEIDPARLIAIPMTLRCADCATEREQELRAQI